ncbi:MAG: serine protein kinase RIO [Methanomassiliicoccales archaeon]|nr:MAG: serine protein kinase RIO [Methanomassiliicoccales archaeon]
MPKRFQEGKRLEHHLESLRLFRSEESSEETRKVLDEVFDQRTMLAIYKFMTGGLIDHLDFPISTGKEGNVFRATTPEGGHVVLKIYRINTATFHSISKYIEGDPRFKGLKGSHRKLIYAWCTKEFKNLTRMLDAGIRVPEPYDFHENILLMEYIGSEERPAPALRSVELSPDVANEFYDEVLKFIKAAYRKAGLVHGDLSEYNILVHEGHPWIIDCGQAVTTDHPNADELLLRDVKNINRYFRSLDVKVKSDEEIMRTVKGVIK